jgi:hypothetical protein
MKPNEASEIEIAVLVEVHVSGQASLYNQNWCPEPYIFCGRPYHFAAFEAQGAARQLDMGNSGQTLTLENASAFDALAPIRDLMQQADGWRRGRVRVITVWPDYPDWPPIVSRAPILNSRINGPAIEISARSPIEAINARVPSCQITNQNVPELPRTN